MVARAVHATGPRGKKPFLGVNCGAIPANLLESELFGSVRGAFTGAERDRQGLFQEADGGTMLLDEIGEMPLKMQSGLLRVLQEKTVRPVGGTKEEPVDVRVIAATNRDLTRMVAAGTFREDLFYRLHVVELHVPPLRERVDDIPPLIDYFLSLFAARYRRDRKTLSRDALRQAVRLPVARQRAPARARPSQRVAHERSQRDARRGRGASGHAPSQPSRGQRRARRAGGRWARTHAPLSGPVGARTRHQPDGVQGRRA